MKKYISMMLVLALFSVSVMTVHANQKYILPQVDAFQGAVFVTQEDGSLWKYDRFDGGTYKKMMDNIIYTSGDAPGFKIYVVQTDGTLIYQNILYDETTTSMPNIAYAMSADRTGNAHFALTKDGRLLSWGWNDNAYTGLFGNGTTEGTEEPYEILNDVKCFDVTTHGGVAVKNNGTVWYWGGYADEGGEYTMLSPVQHQLFITEKAVKACISDNLMLVLKENGELSALIPYQDDGARKLLIPSLAHKKVVDMDVDNNVLWLLYEDGTCIIGRWHGAGYNDTYTIKDVRSVSIHSSDNGADNYIAVVKNDNSLWLSVTRGRWSWSNGIKDITYTNYYISDFECEFVKILDNVKVASTNWGFGAALTIDNELYVWDINNTTQQSAALWVRKVYPQTADISVTLNGIPIVFDQLPIIENGRTLVPLRAIFEALGAEVNWDGNTQTVTAVKDETTISLQIDSSQMNVNGEIKTLDVPAKLINGRTLVPVRAISEAFGCKVDWDENMKMVVIAQ